jgi:hypothetical protein
MSISRLMRIHLTRGHLCVFENIQQGPYHGFWYLLRTLGFVDMSHFLETISLNWKSVRHHEYQLIIIGEIGHA